MRRSLLATTILIPAALAACTRADSVPPAAIAQQTATVGEAAAGPVTPATADAPQIGSFGFDEAGMDRSVAPGDNFYEYANGTWARTTEIPADKSNYGMFSVLNDLSQERTHQILEEARASGSKIGTAYAAYLDTAAIDAAGLAPIKPWFDRLKALRSHEDYVAILGEADRMGVSTPFGAYVGQDDKDPETYALNLSQSGLGLPDRDYYLSDQERLVTARNAYRDYLAQMLTLAGEPNAAERAAAVLAFETEIAKAHWTRIESRDADKTYNKMTVAELMQQAPGFDFRRYFNDIGAPVDSVIVAQPSAVTGIAALVRSTPVDVLRDQLMLRSLRSYASVLPSAIDQANFAFYGTALSGTPEQQLRWKRAVDFTSGALADEVSKEYVARYFPPETKAAADELVRNVTEAMGRRIAGLDWMSPETKAQALAKLRAFTPKIGYPDRWRDYSNLEIREGDAFGNAVRASQWGHDYNVTKLGKPIYRWEWGMTPMTVNAYANFGMVEIVFPAAILQPPFFDPNADPAINYGGIGAVIGHEISHHFDDQGSKYDATGQLTQWWTPEDLAKFQERTAALVAQYDAYEVFPESNVQGALTLGENVADLAGLTVAYDAYRHSLNGAEPPVLDGFTGDERFYLGWAQVWRRNYREAELRQRLMTDSHSPSEQRAAVVRNLDPWYAAFDPQAGQTLYLPPEARVQIW